MAAIQQQGSGISDITELLNLFRNQNTTQSGSQNSAGTSNQSTTGNTSSTVKNEVSGEALGALLQQILGGTQGLASVASGQKAAGLYNSTTNQQLSNDLISRSAGEVAKLNTATTTTGTNNQNVAGNTTNGTTTNNIAAKQAPLDLGKTLAGVLAGQVLAPAGKALSKKLGEYGTNITDSLFGGSSSGVGSFAGEGGGLGGAGGALGQGGDYGLSAALNSGAGTSASSAAIDVASALGASEVGSGVVGSLGLEGGLDAAGIGAGAGDLGAIEGAGALAGGAELAGAAGTGAEVFGAAEAATAAEAIGGEELAVLLFWIICTELTRQNRMPKRYYIHGAKVFNSYPSLVREGYYLWAIPSVRHLRAKPDSIYSRFLSAIFNARAENIAAHAGVRGAKKSIAGAAVTAILYPICAVLGISLRVLNVKLNPLSVYSSKV